MDIDAQVKARDDVIAFMQDKLDKSDIKIERLKAENRKLNKVLEYSMFLVGSIRLFLGEINKCADDDVIRPSADMSELWQGLQSDMYELQKRVDRAIKETEE